LLHAVNELLQLSRSCLYFDIGHKPQRFLHAHSALEVGRARAYTSARELHCQTFSVLVE